MNQLTQWNCELWYLQHARKHWSWCWLTSWPGFGQVNYINSRLSSFCSGFGKVLHSIMRFGQMKIWLGRLVHILFLFWDVIFFPPLILILVLLPLPLSLPLFHFHFLKFLVLLIPLPPFFERFPIVDFFLQNHN